MIICHEPKIVFVKPNKIAGTSIVNTLSMSIKFDDSLRNLSKGDHESYRQIEQTIPIEKYYVFSFTRNPWDRLISMFKYMKEIEIPKRKKMNIQYDEKLEKMTFNEYISSDDVFKPRSFYDFFKNNDGKINLDFIGKFEDLLVDFKRVERHTNLKFEKLAHRYKTNHKEYTEYYTDETQKIVAKQYANDIKYFNYEFGS